MYAEPSRPSKVPVQFPVLVIKASPIAVPFHTPEVIVPKVMRLVPPAHVDRAVFSTLFNAKEFFKFAVVVPASDPVPFAYRRSPTVYEDKPVPPDDTPSGAFKESEPTVNAPIFPFVAKRFVDEAVLANKLVEVAFVLVEFEAVKLWSVEDPVVKKFARVVKPLKVFAPTKVLSV
jgi:hypothetical protein